MSPKLQQVIRRAKKKPQEPFTSIAHLLTLDLYREAWRNLNKGSSAGVDGITAKAYGENLEKNLRGLHERVKAGTYKAPPARRVWIPKDDGSRRALAVPCMEDKIVQGAVRILLEAIYEQDFLPNSYGFRPRRNPHQAIQAMKDTIVRHKVNYVVDVDIKGFFDTMEHEWIKRFVKHRINDRTIKRLIGKWLNAGVLEEGKIKREENGSPQGGVISPVLSNIYLHYVLDLWAHHKVGKQMRGEMYMIRYADDVIFCFQYHEDVQRFQAMLKDRLAKFGLKLNEEKTKVVEFGRFAGQWARRRGQKPGTFEFLGFKHSCGETRGGKFAVKSETSGKGARKFLKRVWQWCKEHRHKPVEEQSQMLGAMLEGHYQYYGITFNIYRLYRVYHHVRVMWKYWLHRRSQRSRVNWTWFNRLLQRVQLPKPHIPHSVYRVRLQGELF